MNTKVENNGKCSWQPEHDRLGRLVGGSVASAFSFWGIGVDVSRSEDFSTRIKSSSLSAVSSGWGVVNGAGEMSGGLISSRVAWAGTFLHCFFF